MADCFAQRSYRRCPELIVRLHLWRIAGLILAYFLTAWANARQPENDLTALCRVVAGSATEWRSPVVVDKTEASMFLNRVIMVPEVLEHCSPEIIELTAGRPSSADLSMIDDADRRAEVFNLLLLTSGLSCLSDPVTAEHFGISPNTQAAIYQNQAKFLVLRSQILIVASLGDIRYVAPFLLALQYDLELRSFCELSETERQSLDARLRAIDPFLLETIREALETLRVPGTIIDTEIFTPRQRESLLAHASRSRRTAMALIHVRGLTRSETCTYFPSELAAAETRSVLQRFIITDESATRFVFQDQSRYATRFRNAQSNESKDSLLRVIGSYPDDIQERMLMLGIGFPRGRNLIRTIKLESAAGLTVREGGSLQDHWENCESRVSKQSNSGDAGDDASESTFREDIATMGLMTLEEFMFLDEMPEAVFRKFQSLLAGHEDDLRSLWRRASIQ